MKNVIILFLYSIFFTYLLHLALKVCLSLHKKKKWKGKESQKLIHINIGIECHLSTRQEKQTV